MNSTLIFAPWILPMDDDPNILCNHAILVENKEIKAIIPQEEAKKLQQIEHIILDNHVLMPGLINLHGHSAMTLLRGLADDLALMDWLNHYIWPAEAKHVAMDFVYDGTLLAMAEMLKSGTTTINDMYFYHAAVAKAGLRMGMRTFVGCSILEFPTNYAQNADAYIQNSLNTHGAFYGEDLIKFTLAPHAPYTVSDDTFKKIVQLAESTDCLIHCHIHETEDEINSSIKEYNMRPIERLHQLGMMSPRLIAAHMVHLNEDEITLCQHQNISISHNPTSNMKLASGCAPVQKLLNHSVNVGLGTDGAASNNKLDMFAEMRLSALIAKGFSRNPTDLKAYDVLKMATINGAKALHMEDQIGSISIGKRADLIAVDLGCIETQPIFDPISHLVYAAGREQVSHVWVNGRMLLKNKQLTTIDIGDLMAKARYWQQRIMDTQ